MDRKQYEAAKKQLEYEIKNSTRVAKETRASNTLGADFWASAHEADARRAARKHNELTNPQTSKVRKDMETAEIVRLLREGK